MERRKRRTLLYSIVPERPDNPTPKNTKNDTRTTYIKVHCLPGSCAPRTKPFHGVFRSTRIFATKTNATTPYKRITVPNIVHRFIVGGFGSLRKRVLGRKNVGIAQWWPAHTVYLQAFFWWTVIKNWSFNTTASLLLYCVVQTVCLYLPGRQCSY